MPHGLRLHGTTVTGGVEAPFELFLAEDGRYRYVLMGPLARVVTFDGEVLAERVRRGPTRVLEREEREGWHQAQWVHGGAWLAADVPLELQAGADADGPPTIGLQLDDAPQAAELTLDPETLRPRTLTRRSAIQDTTITFEDYDTIAGIAVATRVRSLSHGVETSLWVEGLEAAEPDPGSRFVASTDPPGDTHFLSGAPSEVELQRTNSGHLLVHPRVDGKDLGWFVLDSGAGQVCIDAGTAEQVGWPAFGSVPAVGVAGSVRASYRQAERLELGPLQIEDPVFVELDLSFLSATFGVEVAGICGYDVFARAVVELDLEAPSLRLFDPATFDRAGRTWSPLLLDGRIPSVRCRYEGEREGWFKLDLGDGGTVTIYTPAVEAEGLLDGREHRRSRLGGVGGGGPARQGELEWFEIGGRRVAPLDTTFSLTEEGVFASAWATGNVGTRMLEPFVLLLDYPQRRLALVPR